MLDDYELRTQVTFGQLRNISIALIEGQPGHKDTKARIRMRASVFLLGCVYPRGILR
jgi:hypothetical protein